MRRGPRLLCGAVLAVALASARAVEPAVPTLAAQEPRAFGWQIGDPVLRSVELQLPAGHRLDLESLPVAGVPGGAVELRRLERDGAADAPRQSLRLHYQLMSSAEQPRLYDLPALRLRVLRPASIGAPIELRLDAMPLLVSPLTGLEAPTRAGLGELRPDRPPLPVPVLTERRVLVASGVTALALLAWLLLWPTVARLLLHRRRPFARAEQAVRRALRHSDGVSDREAAMRALHAAFDAEAGRVLLPQDALAHARASATLAALGHEVQQFFEASSRHFFGPAGSEPAGLTAGQLRTLARRLREAEADASSRDRSHR